MQICSGLGKLLTLIGYSVRKFPRPEHIRIQYYDFLSRFLEYPWYGLVYYVQAICITQWG